MFSFRLISIATIIAFTTIQATDAKYPITPNELADLHNVGAGVNTPNSEYTPFITPDERFLFFQSNRSPSVGPEGDYDLWYSMNKNAGKAEDPLFETSANVGIPINSESLDGHPSLRKLPSGEYEMYFSSFASPKRTGPKLTNIYYTVWRGGKWIEPQPVAELNSEYHDRMPSVSQDGRYMFFSSDRPGGHGGDDIWFSELDMNTGKWGVPQNAGNINTPASEVTPAIHSDGITLYYSSNREGGVGGYDIYFTQSVARLENPGEAHMLAQGWTQALNLGKPFNSEFDDEYPTVTANGARVYFSSNRSEGRGAFDIYRARVPDFARPTARLHFTGKTLIAGSKRPVGATVELKAGPLVNKTDTSTEKGAAFDFEIINQRVYNIEATAKGFKLVRDEFDTRGLHDGKGVEKDLLFVRDIKLPANLSLKLQFTDSDQQPLKVSAKARLIGRDKKLEALKKGAALPVMVLSDYADEATAITALETMVVEVEARKKGYQTRRQRIALGTILDNYSGELPETIEATVNLSRKGSEPAAPAKEPAEPPQEPSEKTAAAKSYLKFIGRIYFNSDDAEKPLGNSKAIVRKAANAWKKNPGRRLFVYGHGDSRGTRAYNLKLSKDRARRIRKELIQLGVAAGKITVQGAGKSQPKVRNDNTEARRQKNRRVEIYITEPVDETAKQPAEVKPESTTEKPAEATDGAQDESKKDDKPAADEPAAEAPSTPAAPEPATVEPAAEQP